MKRRRLLLLIPVVVLGLIASLGLSGCHPTTPYEVCMAFRPHAAEDNSGGASAWTWAFGVYSCRVRHGPDGSSLYHTYCLYDDGNHWYVKFACAGPQLTEDEKDAGLELIPDGEPDDGLVTVLGPD